MSRAPASRARLWTVALTFPAVTVLAAAAGCSGAEAGAAPRRHLVEIRGMEYHPAVLRLAANDTVVWINRDMVPHTVTAGRGGWNSESVAPGASWIRIAAETDAGAYTCLFHPGMAGRLVIH